MTLPTHCRFDDWATLRERLGLRIVGGGDPKDFPPVLLVELLGQEAIPMPEVIEKSKSKLNFVLTMLLHRAEMSPGQVMDTKLPSGLTVKVNCEIDGTTRLLLARENVYPSDTEYATILAHWPYDVSLDVVPEKFEYSNNYKSHWFCLRARWETPAKEEA
jgi:hypothetical protein